MYVFVAQKQLGCKKAGPDHGRAGGGDRGCSEGGDGRHPEPAARRGGAHRPRRSRARWQASRCAAHGRPGAAGAGPCARGGRAARAGRRCTRRCRDRDAPGDRAAAARATAQALPVLERATTRQPAFPLAFHELGVLLCSLRRLAEAQAVLERGLEIAPAMPELSVVLGGVFLDRLDRPNAKLAFARALACAPGHAGALYGLGTLLMDDGDFAAAADRFQAGARARPRLFAGTGQPRHLPARARAVG